MLEPTNSGQIDGVTETKIDFPEQNQSTLVNFNHSQNVPNQLKSTD